MQWYTIYVSKHIFIILHSLESLIRFIRYTLTFCKYQFLLNLSKIVSPPTEDRNHKMAADDQLHVI